jgi:serine/threonine protein kinase
LEQEGQSVGVIAVVQRLQALLDSPAFTDVPQRQSELHRCDVVVDMTKALAYGQSSRVYAGTLYGLTEVAVKAVRLVDEDALEKMVAEVCRTKALARHRNVIHVFGIIHLDDCTVGVIMERLAAPLQLAAVSDTAMRMKYTLDIIAGMEHLHSADERVRFDFSPTNLLLTHDGSSVKIIDYCVVQRNMVLRGAFERDLGPFIAPELSTEEWRPTSACDVYSFAVVVAELWTGTVVWENEEYMSVCSYIKSGRRPFSPCELSAKGVPDPIIALIVACWAQKPERRPTFRQLGEILTIPNLHLSPHEAWPSFLRAASSGLP